uniref:Uncharacterized protein n=1 Tax=Rhizophora mucronata TaxID=61149 RepID=A0A2P2QW91_RHIMU
MRVQRGRTLTTAIPPISFLSPFISKSYKDKKNMRPKLKIHHCKTWNLFSILALFCFNILTSTRFLLLTFLRHQV